MGEEYVTLTFDGYNIYKNDKYFLCMSNEQVDSYQLYVGFSMLDLNITSKVANVDEIRKVSDLINSFDKSGIYVLPVISPTFLEQAALENDDRIYNKIIIQDIQPITSEIYHRLEKKGKKVNQVIKMIKQNDTDKKIIGWLSMKFGDSFIDEIDLTSLQTKITKIEKNKNVNTLDVNARDVSVHENKIVKENLNKEVLPNASFGFGNIKIMLLILIGALVLGISLGYLLIK